MSHNRPTIEILLASCNGARFLSEQLDTLLAQSFRDFRILVSDDGSEDATVAVLARYADAHPERIELLPRRGARMGASANFGMLLEAASADYVAFCDQDDVWCANKLESSLALMRQLEADAGHAVPLLVHTDLAVVDAELNELGPSFWRYAGIDPSRDSFGDLLLGNIATGCTLLANRALYETARPIPGDALMFDFWLAQVAAGLGRIGRLAEPTVLYRQHPGNLIGARRPGPVSLLAWARRTLLSDKTLRVLSSFSRHAALLLERYGARLSPADARKAAALAKVWSLPRHRRFASLRAAGLSKPGPTRNAGLFLLLLRRPRWGARR